MTRAIIAWERSPTNISLARAEGWLLLDPLRALKVLGPGDLALARLDVRQTLDGIQPGLEALGELSARGVTVLNGPSTLLATHDKLLTARLLAGVGLPHPETVLVTVRSASPGWRGPVVVKPRFGSWGLHVVRCESAAALEEHLATVARQHWFRTSGAIVQALVPPSGFDLRLVVAGRKVVGATMRVSAPGEWRTNVSLGGTRMPAVAPPEAVQLAVAAAAAVNGGLVGVDLLPTGLGSWTVLEVNGAVDFTQEYADGGDVFAAARAELHRRPADVLSPLVGAVA
jgi:[lysine-biosynthesis-protein LysW]--L-2-aminoadipate ligase